MTDSPRHPGDRPPDESRPMTPATAAADSPGPLLSYEEAKAFNGGFREGATAYAAAVGHPTLKRENAKLREVCDDQGWKAIEAFERRPPMPEHLRRLVGEWLASNRKRPRRSLPGISATGCG